MFERQLLEFHSQIFLVTVGGGETSESDASGLPHHRNLTGCLRIAACLFIEY